MHEGRITPPPVVAGKCVIRRSRNQNAYSLIIDTGVSISKLGEYILKAQIIFLLARTSDS